MSPFINEPCLLYDGIRFHSDTKKDRLRIKCQFYNLELSVEFENSWFTNCNMIGFLTNNLSNQEIIDKIILKHLETILLIHKWLHNSIVLES